MRFSQKHNFRIGQKSYSIKFAWYPRRRTNGKWSWLEDLYIEETWVTINRIGRWIATKVQNERDILES